MSKAFVKEGEGEPEVGRKASVIGPRHITPEGFRRLERELDHLWKVERPHVTAGVAAAAADGDRSENAAYIYGKRRLREIDHRIEYLTKLLDALVVVEPRDMGDRVYFGAYVTVEDEEGQVSTYRIVGPDESDFQAGTISCLSPVALALLGRREGETVMVRRPKGDLELEIVEVRYSPPP